MRLISFTSSQPSFKAVRFNRAGLSLVVARHTKKQSKKFTPGLSYLDADEEIAIVQARVPSLANGDGRATVSKMVVVAELTRKGFAAGDLATLMSPRTVITWAENLAIFGDAESAFRMSFANRLDDADREIVAEYYQRAFDRELSAR